MTCVRHPDREAAGTCSVCGKPFCEDCLVPVEDQLLCKDCNAIIMKQLRADKSDPTAAEAKETLPPPKAYSIYVGLALIVGLTGAHHFYAGFVGRGVAMLFINIALILFAGFLEIFPFGLIISAIVCLIEAASQKNDAYGRPLV